MVAKRVADKEGLGEAGRSKLALGKAHLLVGRAELLLVSHLHLVLRQPVVVLHTQQAINGVRGGGGAAAAVARQRWQGGGAQHTTFSKSDSAR